MTVIGYCFSPEQWVTSNPLHTHHTALRPQQSDYSAKLKDHVHHCSQPVPSLFVMQRCALESQLSNTHRLKSKRVKETLPKVSGPFLCLLESGELPLLWFKIPNRVRWRIDSNGNCDIWIGKMILWDRKKIFICVKKKIRLKVRFSNHLMKTD